MHEVPTQGKRAGLLRSEATFDVGFRGADVALTRGIYQSQEEPGAKYSQPMLLKSAVGAFPVALQEAIEIGILWQVP